MDAEHAQNVALAGAVQQAQQEASAATAQNLKEHMVAEQAEAETKMAKDEMQSVKEAQQV